MDMLKGWIEKYKPTSQQELFNAKREIVQEITLAGLWRGSFFKYAAFYGGTALRVLYGLDRYSEDLDFSLLEKNADFDLLSYQKYIVQEFNILNLDVKISRKQKKKYSAIDSAFLKDNSDWTLLNIRDLKKDRIFPDIKIKIEVDRNPPLGFECESKVLNRPYVFYVNSMTKENLFAGKMHALLFRKWKNNVKGRDWYDLLWYISRDIPLKLSHFRQRAIESGAWPEKKEMVKSDLLSIYHARVDQLDIEKAKSDIARFIADDKRINIWSRQLFHDIAEKIQVV